MSELYNYIEALCKEKGTNITEMCRSSGASRGSLTDLKMGRISSLTTKTLSKISKYLNVPISFLLHPEGGEYNPIVYCLDCGFEYNVDNQEEYLQHTERHEAWSKAVKKFGFCWPYRVREPIKAAARNKIDDGGLNVEEYIEEQIKVFKALFSRSLEGSDYDLNHVDFPTYVSMLLFQEQWQKKMPTEVYDEMKSRFGVQSGIPTGTYYQAQSVQKLRPLKKRASKKISSRIESAQEKMSTEEQTHIQKYRLLDPYGKEAVESILDIEYRRCCEPDQTSSQKQKEIPRRMVPAAARSGDVSEIEEVHLDEISGDETIP